MADGKGKRSKRSSPFLPPHRTPPTSSLPNNGKSPKKRSTAAPSNAHHHDILLQSHSNAADECTVDGFRLNSHSNTNKKSVAFVDVDTEAYAEVDDIDDLHAHIDATAPTYGDSIALPESLSREQKALQDLQDIILLYQQAIHDVHQAVVDVKETKHDVADKVKSITEQLHMLIDRREDELLEEITKKTASKVFTLDEQFTKLNQRLMFCVSARDEAQELLVKYHEYNEGDPKPAHSNGTSSNERTLFKKASMPIAKLLSGRLSGNKMKTRSRDHSGGSVINYNARFERIMKMVNDHKRAAKNEFEKDLNRGMPVVCTRFHVDHWDITPQLETLGSIVEDSPLPQYQLHPPAITKTRALPRSIRIGIKSREKIDAACDYEVLSCQFEPQLVFVSALESALDGDDRDDEKQNGNSDDTPRMHYKSSTLQSVISAASSLPMRNPDQLSWQSLGWIALNPAPSTQLPSFHDSKSDGQSTRHSDALTNLQRLKKELDLDEIVSEHSKLITGLEDLLSDVDGKHVYIRVRMRKLVKFEGDIISASNSPNSPQDSSTHLRLLQKRKSHSRKKNKSSNNLFDGRSSNVDADDDDRAPLVIESHFSRAVKLNVRTIENMAATPSIAELASDVGDDGDDDDYDAVNGLYDDDFDDMHDEKDEKEEDSQPHKKSKKKKSKRNKKKKKSSHNVTIGPFFPPDISLKRQGTLYDDGDFTKQRRHSNYHIQDELYEPGILLLDKSRIVWHDIVNNKDIVVSDKIPVSARSSCGMVVAHDVLVADDEPTEEAANGHTNDDENGGGGSGGRYTSIMFRIGGTLNKKTDRSVDMLDLGTGMWSSLPSLKHHRSLCQPVLMNGNIVCAGGCSKKTKPLNSVELFDFEASKWKELSALKESRWGHAVYVMYYEDNEQIARTPSMANTPQSQAEHAKVIVCGGWGKKKRNLKTAEIYDSATNKWSNIASMNVARSRCVAMEWTNIDRVGVIGGWGDLTKIVEYYDSNKDAWYRLKDLNYEHINPACGLLSDQHLYAMNRFLEPDAKQMVKLRRDEFEREMDAPHINHKISQMRGRPAPFVLGSNDQFSCLELFDDRSDQWIVLQTFPRSQNPIMAMIECALPQTVTNEFNARINTVSSPRGQWQRRGSKILGML